MELSNIKRSKWPVQKRRIEFWSITALDDILSNFWKALKYQFIGQSLICLITIFYPWRNLVGLIRCRVMMTSSVDLHKKFKLKLTWKMWKRGINWWAISWYIEFKKSWIVHWKQVLRFINLIRNVRHGRDLLFDVLR